MTAMFLMPMLGFGPAPAYASKSELENRIQFLFSRYAASEMKSSETGANAKLKTDARTEYLGALQRGDKVAELVAAENYENGELGKAVFCGEPTVFRAGSNSHPPVLHMKWGQPIICGGLEGRLVSREKSPMTSI
jgi:hypothetical protein